MAVTSVVYEYGGKGYDERSGKINFDIGDVTGSVQTGLTVLISAFVTAIGTATQAVPTNNCNVLLAGLVGTSGTGHVLTGGTLAFQRYNGALGTVATGTAVQESYFWVVKGYK